MCGKVTARKSYYAEMSCAEKLLRLEMSCAEKLLRGNVVRGKVGLEMSARKCRARKCRVTQVSGSRS